MSIFQKSLATKYLTNLDEAIVNQAFVKYNTYFKDPTRLFNITQLNEENYQEGFLRELFVDVLGYTINPNPNFNLTTEFKNQTDSKKADGAILRNGQAIGVIELKSTRVLELNYIEKQAFNYKNNQPNCRYVITSTFKIIRLYIDNSTQYEEFDLFKMDQDTFKQLYLVLSKDSIFNDIPIQLKGETIQNEDNITDRFYKDYKLFKEKIYENIVQKNPDYDKIILLKKTRKLLDRILFIAFAEDKGLIPPNAISRTIEKWKIFVNEGLKISLYRRYQVLFENLNVGFTYPGWGEIPAYNGGLFTPDDILDNPSLIIDNEIIKAGVLSIAKYDFNTEIDVNILGHIFEHSLNEFDEITNQPDLEKEKKQNKRKKDGVFYTPDYITKYIVENSVGEYCVQKKLELGIAQIFIDETFNKNGKITKKGKEVFEKIQAYKNWLSNLKIIDPACGSGAFLIAVLDFLILEHKETDALMYQLSGVALKLFDTDKIILEKNIYGVDINEESVEIAKLSLWLHTAQKQRKLSDLSANIKCGNSLIDKPEIAGDKAFAWNEEFSEIMANGGFDVVVGNPPYGVKFTDFEKKYLQTFDITVPDFEIYIYFISLALNRLLKKNGIVAYIFPNTFLSRHFGAEYRSKILNNYTINYITNLSTDLTFVDASVRTCIVSIQNTLNENKLTDLWLIDNELKKFEKQKTVDKDFLQLNISNWLNLFRITNHQQNLIIKLQKFNKLSDFFEVSQGLIPYDKYRGHSEETIKKRIWHSSKKKDETYKKELKGGDIKRYALIWNAKTWISYGNWLAAPRAPKFFINPRILIREIAENMLFCTFTDEEYYNTPSIINIIQNPEYKLNLKFLLAILNSNVMGWYHNNTSPKAQKGLFPKILINDVRNLPIKYESHTLQEKITNLVDKMLLTNKLFHSQLAEFTHRFEINFDKLKITDGIKNSYKVNFKTILDELEKQKIRIKPWLQKDWEAFYLDNQQILVTLEDQILKTERDLQNEVYALFDLTNEEIQLIENAK